ncbi:Alkyltransferase-like protein 1 [Rhodotorula kratochvilovae]
MPAERRARTVAAAAPSTRNAAGAGAGAGAAASADEDDSFRRDFNAAVYECVRRIPEGKVCSYGQIAKLIGHPRHSRMVGAALKVLPKRLSLPFLPPAPSSTSSASSSAAAEQEPDVAPEPETNPDWVPWHRVVSSSGLISPRGNPAATARQAEWLEAEGVVVRSGPGAAAAGGGREEGDAFGLGVRVEGGGRVSMGAYAWKG